jgi:hypothetical protein
MSYASCRCDEIRRHLVYVCDMGSGKLALTSPTSGGRSVGIVRSRTQTMEFVCLRYLALKKETSCNSLSEIRRKGTL